MTTMASLLGGAPRLDVSDDGRLGESVRREHGVLELEPEATRVGSERHVVRLRVTHVVVGQQRQR